jgi:hypothetical protein
MKADYGIISEEEKCVLCNGCGPQNMSWLRPFIPQLVFEEAGNRHDFDYHVGGGYQEYARSNLRFLANCLLSVSNNSPWHSIPYHLVMAVVYYLAVKLGGKASFHFGTLRTHEQIQEIARIKIARQIITDLEKEVNSCGS